MKIVGKGIYIRPIALSDVTERYLSWMNDPEVNQYLESRFYPQTLESIREFVQSKIGSDRDHLFAICKQDDDRHVGNIKVGPIDFHHRCAELGLLVGDKSEWGKGVASEAIRLVTQFSFEELKLNKLRAGAYAPNQGSIAAFLRCGFTQEGRFKNYFSIGDDQFCDGIQFGLCAVDWVKSK
jgi:RimJ/RimL family protein N-acetyltransferase